MNARLKGTKGLSWFPSLLIDSSDLSEKLCVSRVGLTLIRVALLNLCHWFVVHKKD
jgi:hypothetical protein